MKIKDNKRISEDGFVKHKLKSDRFLYSQLLLIKYALVNKIAKSKRKGNILMLHNGRVGSTVLADLLNQHSKIHWDGELYIEQDKYTDRIFQDPLRFLEIKMNQFATEYYGFELKAMKNQHPKRFLKMDLEKYITEITNLNVTYFIILKRKNYLKQYISLTNARRKNIKHTNKIPDKTEKIVLEIQNCNLGSNIGTMVENFNKLDEHYLTLEKTLAGFNVLNLIYEEDILADPIIAYHKICGFLKIESEKPIVNLRRTNPFGLDKMIENYDEVAGVLKNTKYEWMLKN